MSFAHVGIELDFEGTGVEELAKVTNCNNPEYQVPVGQVVVKIDQNISDQQKLIHY